HMLVLDADSVMAGPAIVRLARLMQANPRAGIIQTLPLPANAETLFGRMLQFASRLYGPVLASGLAWWQLGEGNYWGHNAILRTRAFAAHCALPHLPGKAPLGGEILSHDFVEAAMIRAGGWKVWIVPDLMGSWEELPPNVIDYAQRDRRWCQGNLQHLKLLPARGFHALSRLHLVMGVMGYLASPLWLLMLLLASADVISVALTGHPYFLPGYQLFPNWPISKTAEIVSLLSVTALLLLLPRLYSLVLILADGRTRRSFGGTFRLLPSAVVELLHSVLLAPSMMMFHVHFVTATLLGHVVTWKAQARTGRGMTVREAVSRLGVHVLLGLVWGAVVLTLAPDFVYWLLPVLIGLMLSVALAFVSSRTDVGAWFRDHGLLLTPEEIDPPSELAMLNASAGRNLPHTGSTDAPAVPAPDQLPMPARSELVCWSARDLAGLGGSLVRPPDGYKRDRADGLS
ncbi:MAG TPA: glucans biosynthesis glucosyltransferase MdoH, partial [Arenibaculum sp.]|nr:glucans biosynthesis glucosyltransferase MdoH [Arenibaculum sp.]